MRRKDREMNREFGLKVIDKSVYGIISMVDKDNEPCGIPLSIVREGDTLYFHSANQCVFHKNSKNYSQKKKI